ncbi:MAG TPA: RcnB family protein [Sphingomicrobium sp.]|nr:RcnB family protein [Sphingomicrobium sp.]
MREFLLLVLLASAASPVLAAQDRDDPPNRRGGRVERAQNDSDALRRENPAARPQHEQNETRNAETRRSDDGNQAAAVRRPARDADGPGVEAVERAERRQAGGAVRSLRQDTDSPVDQTVRKPRRPTLPGPRVVQDDPNDPVAPGDSVRRGRRGGGEAVGSSIEERNLRTAPNVREAGGLVQSRRELPRVFEPADRRVSPTPRFGTEPPAPRTSVDRRAQPTTRWNTGWRHDRRYDWHDWRRRHRSRFHFGIYSDPFGWDYFRYGIGWRLWPSYYRSSYWLHDPWEYRLPPAYGPYRWIRYHGDALLVNIYTGQVVDVIYGFFW